MASKKELKKFLKDNISMKALFLEGDLKETLQQLANSSLSYYGFNKIPIYIIWDESENAEVAYINDTKCVINVASCIDKGLSYNDRKKLAIGKLTHEVFGHGLFTNFKVRNCLIDEFEKGNFPLEDYFQKTTNYDPLIVNEIKDIHKKNTNIFPSVYFQIENIIEDPNIEYLALKRYPGLKKYVEYLVSLLVKHLLTNTEKIDALGALLMQARNCLPDEILKKFPELSQTQVVFDDIYENKSVNYSDRIINSCYVVNVLWKPYLKPLFDKILKDVEELEQFMDMLKQLGQYQTSMNKNRTLDGEANNDSSGNCGQILSNNQNSSNTKNSNSNVNDGGDLNQNNSNDKNEESNNTQNDLSSSNSTNSKTEEKNSSESNNQSNSGQNNLNNTDNQNEEKSNDEKSSDKRTGSTDEKQEKSQKGDLTNSDIESKEKLDEKQTSDEKQASSSNSKNQPDASNSSTHQTYKNRNNQNNSDEKDVCNTDKFDDWVNKTVQDYVDEVMSEINQEQLQQEYEKNLIKQSSKDNDFHKNYNFEMFDLSKERDEKTYNKVCENNSLKGIAHTVATKIIKAIKVRQKGNILYEQEEGQMVDIDAFARGSDKCFMSINQPNKKPILACSVMIDQSGSMCGDKIKAARNAAIVLERFCRELKIPLHVYGHNDISRVKIYNYIDFNDPPTPKRGYQIASLSCNGRNRDGMALRYGVKKLALRSETAKIMFVISDGSPNSANYGIEEAILDIAEIKSICKKKKITLVALAIDEDIPDLERIYGSSLVDARNLNDLPKNLTSLLLKKMKRII